MHTPLDPSMRVAPAMGDRRAWTLVAAILLVAAFAMRAIQFGNPLIHVDENFYLLVGDRMLHGALPFVDIWDRKPIGLFLIYAAIRLLGGGGIFQYQVVATLFVAGTAFLIARMAAQMTTLAAATVAAILYMLLLGFAQGQGGQAPIFYNLFMAGAAMATLHAGGLAPRPSRTVTRLGAVAMALTGIALQIKYTVLFEGVFFGIVLLHASWKADPRPARLLADAALWIGLALAPTLAALLFYVAKGQTEAFVYANFLSIGNRTDVDASTAELFRRLEKAWAVLHLPMVCVLLAWLLEPWRRFPLGLPAFRFIATWLGVAVGGYLVFGTYFDHYILPLMVPITIAAAPLFSYRPHRFGLIAACVLLVGGTVAYEAVALKQQRKRGTAPQMAAMVAAIKPHLTNCLYVWNGDSLLYYMTGSCLPSRYAFPTHLNLRREAGAIGIDPAVEVRRILANRPSVIVDTKDYDLRQRNLTTLRIVRAELQRNYRPVYSIPIKGFTTVIYARLPGR